MVEQIETLIVGGGQAGLAQSYRLTQQGREHLVLEQAAQAGNVWRHERWDSFTLVTPNWMIQLPGAEYQGNDPDGFMPRDQVVAYLERYAQRFNLPIRYGVQVASVEKNSAGYLVKTNHAVFEAANVIVATGLFQKPRIPSFSAKLPAEIKQLASTEYRNPNALPAGAVLVVGSAQSGCQIAEELYQSGRRVFLSVGSAGRIPRRYRGKDTVWWLDKTGFFDQTADKLPSPKAKFVGNPQATGKDGGHTINLHQFARDGVVLLGHLQGAQNGKAMLAPDLAESLAKVDKFEAGVVKMIDDYIETTGLDAPKEDLPELRDGYRAQMITELDLQAAGITSIIWAMGYTFDFSLVKLPVLDSDGYPIQKRGVTLYPGLFFLGMHFLHTRRSGILSGVGDDAAYLATKMVERAKITVH